MANVFKRTMRDGKKSSCYYGKVKVAEGKWLKKKLFSDKAASQRRLVELQKEADQRAQGMYTPDTEVLRKPIKELRDLYVEQMKQARRKPDHIRISEFMLDTLTEYGNWHAFRDITRENVEKIVARVATEGGTVSYQNKFIVRAKAFVHHFLPEGWPDPLKRLRRIPEKGAKRTRGRRAATPLELNNLLSGNLPAYRLLAYALAGLNGLRRNEIEALTWENIHLNAPIPYVGIPPKQRAHDALDYVPLHPYVLKLIQQQVQAMPGVSLVKNVPDVQTLEKDWAAVGVKMTDDRGLRLDVHALRHTFQTRLDQTGCSRATKKKLMRHAGEDVTDGYAHAELAEMLEALKRLPSPGGQVQAKAVKTGTAGAPVMPINMPAVVDHQLDHGMTIQGQPAAATVSAMDTRQGVFHLPCHGPQPRYNAEVGSNCQHLLASDSENDRNFLQDNNLRPSTQAD